MAAAKDQESVISEELETLLHRAFLDARHKRHEFITVEHLLLSLVDAPGLQEIWRAYTVNPDDLKKSLTEFVDTHTPRAEGTKEVDTQPTLGFQRVIQRAILRVQSFKEKEKEKEKEKGRKVQSGDVLIAIYGENDSHSVYFLHQQGLSRADVVNYLAGGEERAKSIRQHYEASTGEAEWSEMIKLVATLAPESQAVAKGANLFVSYSHADATCLQRLLVHLKPLERAKAISCWSDRQIRPGDKWKKEIEKNLNDAAIAVLLLSADFLASDFIVNNELPPLLVKAEARGVRILPVILKPCGFLREPVLSSFQAINDPAKPLLGLTDIEQEDIYNRIADAVWEEVRSKERDK